MASPLIAGNWKMNTTLSGAMELVAEMRPHLEPIKGIQKVVCPPFVSLAAVAEMLRGSSISVGAQNMYHQDKGAYTGEVSSAMLAGLCQFVILGHSERRQLFGETDESINLKVAAAIGVGMRPILCVGEHLQEREEGRAEGVVETQLRGCLAEMEAPGSIAVAYEPVWAIGTGRAATAEVAQSMMGHIRSVLTSLYGADVAGAISLLYGGSVSPDNASEYMGQPDVDGALVGGASLTAGSFVEIVRQTAQAKT